MEKRKTGNGAITKLLLLFTIIVVKITCIQPFQIGGIINENSMETSESSTMSHNSESRPDLVNKESFLEAVETIEKEIARINGQEYINDKDQGIEHAIGRLEVILPIPPGIDLVETPQLVLVNGIDLKAHQAGIKPLDTIVSVSVGHTYHEKTKALTIDETFEKVKSAISHAKAQGITEIKLELNRLIKGYYETET